MRPMDHYASMEKVIAHIVERKLEAKPLEEIAASMGMSPGHLQKLFTRWVGISPKQFGRYLSLEYAKELLGEHGSLDTAVKAGLSSGGRLHDLFVDIEAMTPGEYRNQGASLALRYSTFPTRFGACLVASTGRGITNVLFSDSPEDAAQELRARWPKASLARKADPSHASVRKYLQGLAPQSKIKLHLRGTNFQIKVWEALLSIPEGSANTYGRVAERAGCPNSSRAVGAAIGENPVGYLIPCHRVLKSTGEISGYRWGVARKRAMLAYEAARRDGRPLTSPKGSSARPARGT